MPESRLQSAFSVDRSEAKGHSGDAPDARLWCFTIESSSSGLFKADQKLKMARTAQLIPIFGGFLKKENLLLISSQESSRAYLMPILGSIVDATTHSIQRAARVIVGGCCQGHVKSRVVHVGLARDLAHAGVERIHRC